MEPNSSQSTPKVVPLRPLVDADVVERLEQLLVEANRGELTGLAVVAVCRDGRTINSISGTGAEDTVRVIGATAILHARALAYREAQAIEIGKPGGDEP